MAWFGMGACAVYDEQVAITVPDSPPMAAIVPAVAGADAPPPEATPVEPACVVASELSPCDALPRLAAAPQLDGVLECGLQLHPLALPSMPLTAAVSYAAAWSDAGFYVYIEVHAPPSPTRSALEPLYCGDAVEVFVDSDGLAGTDGRYNAPGTMQFVIGAPEGTDMITGRYLAGEPQGPWISDKLSVAQLDDGYAVETLVVGSDLGLWEWRPSGQMGFNLAVNFAGAGEPRGAPCTTGVGQSVLRVAAPQLACDGRPWCDTRSFCWPLLLE
ncbi:MAG TPA: hypothetical protein VMF89_03690 [Polyangiales bacterium]|nr:hypothetical protein [Polyangiales bacterium]